MRYLIRNKNSGKSRSRIGLIWLNDKPRTGASIAWMAGVVAERIIAGMPMFRHVPRARVAALARHCAVLRLKRGDAACRRGETANGLYAVIQGQVKLVLRADHAAEKVLRVAGPGETFGEALVYRPRPNPIDAVALCDALVVAFPASAIHALVERDRGFARRLLASLSDRVHGLLASIEASALFSARQRIASYLIALAESSRDATRIRLPMTKTLIASQLGITKETLSRMLREFADAGLISMQQRVVVLRNPALLAKAARPAPARDTRASGSPAA